MSHRPTRPLVPLTRRWLEAIGRGLLLASATCLVVACGLPTRTSRPVASTPAPTPRGSLARIGAVLTLTGSASAAGSAQHNGLKLAEEEINADKLLGSARLEVIVEDAPDRARASDAFQKFVNTSHLVAILGPTLSDDALAVDPIAQQAGVPVVAISNPAGGLTEIGSFVFREGLAESQINPAVVKAVKNHLNVRRAALLYADTDANRSGSRGFKKALKEGGVEVVAEETFVRGETDFSAQLIDIASADPDALFVSSPAAEAPFILIQARQHGMTNLPIVGSGAFASLGVIRRAGAAAEGLVVGVSWSANNPNPRNKQFVENYRSRYETDPDLFAAQAYTGVYLVGTAIRNAGTARDRRAVRDSLARLKDVDTPLGKFSFNEAREPSYAPSIEVVRGGRLEPFGN
jgi:branched-chain amino acid transport system substrate-binding protein